MNANPVFPLITKSLLLLKRYIVWDNLAMKAIFIIIFYEFPLEPLATTQ